MFDFLSRSFSSLFSKFSSTSLSAEETSAFLKKVVDTLLEADVPLNVAEHLAQDIKQKVEGKVIPKGLKPSEYIMKVVHDALLTHMGGGSDASFAFQIPSTIMVLGLQGSGKTTSLAKLAYHVQATAKKRGKTRRILLASVDFYRPAAIQQLEILAERSQIPFYRSPLVEPVAAAKDIHAYAHKNGFELLFLDTAGRMHIDGTLLEELKTIDRHLSPKYKLLVLDAMTGQQSLAIAQAFEDAVGFTGALLSKMDSDTRGGAALSFRYVLKKPILFVGNGEKLEDLEPFRPERMVSRMLGMGDMATLVEQANAKIKQADQEKAYNTILQGKMTLEDFAQQLDMMNKLGSLTSIMKYLPGASSLSVTPDQLEKGEGELKRFRAIINSMTPKERRLVAPITISRKERIARGAGVLASDVTLFLSRFEQSQQYVKLFKKMGVFSRLK